MAISITDKTGCTGCEACAAVCPRKSIVMKADVSGFLYPVVDTETCVECGLCEKICPVLHAPEKKTDFEQKAFAGWSKNQALRYNSTSGGLFSELASCVIREHGCAAGAVYGENCEIVHDVAADMKGLEGIRQSKYAQCHTGDIFSKVQELLKAGKKVIFCGTPCHAAALRNYLKKEYENLYIVDFICRGVNSPKAYRSWLCELEKKQGAKATKVWFKYKKYGWKNSPRCTRVDFADGSSVIQDGYKNTYMCGYLGPNLYIRPSCSDCKFKGTERDSDITLADFWGITKELDDDRGTSLIIVNTKKGQELLDKIKGTVFLQERSIREIHEGNACFTSSVVIHPKSEEFLSRLDTEDFSKLLHEYAKVSWKRRGIEACKRGVKKVIRVWKGRRSR